MKTRERNSIILIGVCVLQLVCYWCSCRTVWPCISTVQETQL